MAIAAFGAIRELIGRVFDKNVGKDAAKSAERNVTMQADKIAISPEVSQALRSVSVRDLGWTGNNYIHNFAFNIQSAEHRIDGTIAHEPILDTPMDRINGYHINVNGAPMKEADTETVASLLGTAADQKPEFKAPLGDLAASLRYYE